MLPEAHRAAALEIESALPALTQLRSSISPNRVLIEIYWGAAFHWTAYGCQMKHGKHKENHTKLVSYLRDIGEPIIAAHWQGLEQARAGGWYGHQNSDDDMHEAQRIWQEIRTWALS